MTLKSFPYKWTCLVGVLFLGSTLWSDIMLDGVGFLLVIISFLCLFISLIASLGIVAIDRSKESLYRILINVCIFLLFFPTVRLGSYLGERLFLMHLGRFQEATNLVIRNAGNKLNAGISRAGASLPPGYSDLHVADYVLLDSRQGNVTVRYTSRDSSALGHRGYLYRSDDDSAALKRDFPGLGYKRIAPHWFFFSD